MRQSFFILFFVNLLFTNTLAAASAVDCHCFSDRSFDPSRPNASDAYLLTTTYNAFTAASLGIDKKTIVRAKMSGTTDEEIWLQHLTAEQSGKSIPEVIRLKNHAGSWEKFVEREDLLRAVRTTSNSSGDTALAQAVVLQALSEFFGLQVRSLSRLQQEGIGIKEIVLSCFLSTQTGKPPQDFTNRFRYEKIAWGLQAQEAGIDFSTIASRMLALKSNR